MLRFEATVHNTKELRCRRSLENFTEIITLLAGMADRFATALDLRIPSATRPCPPILASPARVGSA